MHANSIEAYHSLSDLGERESRVLDCYLSLIFPITDRECMSRLGFRDPNAVRPRVTALVGMGLLEECGKVKDQETHKSVRLCRPTAHALVGARK